MFYTFQTAVGKQFAKMSKGRLFTVQLEKGQLYEVYLKSFPEGTNSIYKTRTEHDCNCCRHFIRDMGGVVAIVEGELVSIWDGEVGNFYNEVSKAMSAAVKAQMIENVFLHTFPTAGVRLNYSKDENGKVIPHSHFMLSIPAAKVVPEKSLATVLGQKQTDKQVFFRALTELTTDAVSTVNELIAQNSLYRGEEFKFLVTSFGELKAAFDKVDKDVIKQERFVWSTFEDVNKSVLGIRNSVIGTLLEDLSAGKDLILAAGAYESRVAPSNYKRPTALVTKGMIEKAKQEIMELGLENSLARRFATIHDLTVNNILFVDRNAKKDLKEASGVDVFDTLSSKVTNSLPKLDKVEEVSINDFLENILPTATSVEVLLENRLRSNLVSLIAPLNPDSKGMFKWDNKFSWSYAGNLADSDLRAAVRARGGRVDGAFRFSHSWNYGARNTSLMDLHVFMPGSSQKTSSDPHDSYGNDLRIGWNRRNDPRSGGIQDVDYTNMAPEGFIPVENITFPDIAKMQEGRYVCRIHNWQLRSPTLGGFKAEIEFGGTVYQYEVTRPLKQKEWVTVAEVTLKNGQFSIKHCLPQGEAPQEVWGLTAGKFYPAKVVMMSPNHWDGRGVGNKHFFFMLEGCLSSDKTRGFYNEFLSEELTPHRKVLEMVGASLEVVNPKTQLSGVGFSSTQRNHLFCKVNGSFTRVVKVLI